MFDQAGRFAAAVKQLARGRAGPGVAGFPAGLPARAAPAERHERARG